MDNAIYIALSKQLVQFRNMDIVAHNVANADTASFKRNVMMQTDWTVDNGNRQKVSFAQDVAMYRDTENGALQQTSNPLDIAIQGKGFFAVETERGIRYTRDGSLTVAPDGTLVTLDGNPILDNAGQAVNIPQEAQDIEFAENGAIFIDGQEGPILDVVAFDNEQKLRREADKLYNPTGEDDQEQLPILAEGFTVVQGFKEKSNVKPVLELTKMVELARSTGRTSQFMDTMYDLQRQAMNAWAKTAQ